MKKAIQKMTMLLFFFMSLQTINGKCLVDNINFTIDNICKNDVVEIEDYIVIQDVVLHRNGSLNIPNGVDTASKSEQASVHPTSPSLSISIEGPSEVSDLLDLGMVGIANKNMQNDTDLFIKNIYQDNIGYFDPIHKHGLLNFDRIIINSIVVTSPPIINFETNNICSKRFEYYHGTRHHIFTSVLSGDRVGFPYSYTNMHLGKYIKYNIYNIKIDNNMNLNKIRTKSKFSNGFQSKFKKYHLEKDHLKSVKGGDANKNKILPLDLIIEEEGDM